MFAYPVGHSRDVSLRPSPKPRSLTSTVVQSLFLERESAEVMDPRNDRTSVVRSRLLNILSLHMQPVSSTTDPKSPDFNASPTLPSADGTPQDKSPSLPQIPSLLPFDSSGLDQTMHRALTPIVEGSGSDRDANRLPAGAAGAHVRPSHLRGNSTSTSAPLSYLERREGSLARSSTRISSPSMYSPTEVTSVPVSPPQECKELLPSTSITITSPEAGTSPTGDGPIERPSIDDKRTTDVDQHSSPPSVRSLRSSVASPPSLSPANSSNPPASVSPGLAPPRTPSPKYSILTSPHSVVETSARPNQSFAEIGIDGLSRQSLTPPSDLRAASLEPSKLSRDSTQTSTVSSTQGIYDEAGALYYIHQFRPDPLDTNAQPELEDDEENLSPKTEVPHASQYVTIAPLRPKTTSPPPTASTVRSLPSIDTTHRKPPSQPLPRTPTLDYGPERRPAGARAAPVTNRQDSVGSSAQPPRNPSIRPSGNVPQGSMSTSEDPDADALVALTFLERHDDDAAVAPGSTPSQPSAAASPIPHPQEEPPTISAPNIRPPTPEGENAAAYKSSFAPSKNAMQRKARTEAQQAAHEAATHRPGRGTKPKHKPKAVGTWGDSSEDEDDEEDDDDEDVDSDGQPVPSRDDRSMSNYSASVNQRSRVPSPRGPSPLASGIEVPPPQPMPRPPRNLPPVPIPRAQGMSHAWPILYPSVLTVSVT